MNYMHREQQTRKRIKVSLWQRFSAHHSRDSRDSRVSFRDLPTTPTCSPPPSLRLFALPPCGVHPDSAVPLVIIKNHGGIT